jgi:hypothetical protein
MGNSPYICSKFITSVAVTKTAFHLRPHKVRVEYLKGVNAAYGEDEHILNRNYYYNTQKEATEFAEAVKNKSMCLRCGNSAKCMKSFIMQRGQ